MFTGIIQSVGIVREISESGLNKTFKIESSISESFKVDQSVSHNGVCLTVENVDGGMHLVTAIKETLDKSNLSEWSVGDKVNLETSMTLNSMLDGHIVQGHVDCKGICESVKEKRGSVELTFTYPYEFQNLLVEKGSIAVNGVSLTAFNCREDQFTVAIIPFTLDHTNMSHLIKGTNVNLEFDIIGKYVQRNLQIPK